MLLYRAYAISDYPAVSVHAAAIMHMIMNNLDSRVAQFPQELVTYGGNGQVFSNWAQVIIVTHHRQCRRYTWSNDLAGRSTALAQALAPPYLALRIALLR